MNEYEKLRIRLEQGEFRKRKGCVNQVFVLKKTVEKYGEGKKDSFIVVMDL